MAYLSGFCSGFCSDPILGWGEHIAPPILWRPVERKARVRIPMVTLASTEMLSSQNANIEKSLVILMLIMRTGLHLNPLSLANLTQES